MALIPVALRRGCHRDQPSTTTVGGGSARTKTPPTMVCEGGGGMHTPLNLALGGGGGAEFKTSLVPRQPGHKKSEFSGISNKLTSILKSPG